MEHKKFAFVFPRVKDVNLGKCFVWAKERKGTVSDMCNRTKMIKFYQDIGPAKSFEPKWHPGGRSDRWESNVIICDHEKTLG